MPGPTVALFKGCSYGVGTLARLTTLLGHSCGLCEGAKSEAQVVCAMVTDNWPVDFRYISKRLVRRIVDQDQAPRSRWRTAPTIAIPHVGSITFQKDRIDRTNEFALCKAATEAVQDLTGTVSRPGLYIQAELDLSMGLIGVHQGWVGAGHHEIAAMYAEVNDPEAGRVFVALFGSASNYEGRKDIPDGLAETASDVDGLYTMLDRILESDDPQISNDYLDEDVRHSANDRTEAATRYLLGERFAPFGEGHFDVLMRRFCTDEITKPYDLVILGAPVWVATPAPRPIRT